ncbi:MAG: hypothetical protein GY869_19640, partial [Planctomycetes bacterium]|nr:hypothetical protein [Planctomycetota bacterium]
MKICKNKTGYAFTLMCLCCASNGCNNTAWENNQPVAPSFNTIETTDFRDRSITAPVSVEEAAILAAQQIPEPNQPKDTLDLTLAQVRAATLANNLDLTVELIDPSIAQQNVAAERAKFESVFFGSVQHDQTEPQGQDDQSGFTSYRAGIDIPLSTGGTISIS